MKKRILLICFIIFDIIILINIFLLINSCINKEKVLIEDVYFSDNHYVATILTTKGKIYYIDDVLKYYDDLNSNSTLLLNNTTKINQSISKQDFTNLKLELKSNNYNKKCIYNQLEDNKRVLLYYDYKLNKKILLSNKIICENWDIIEIIQKYGMWLSDV